MRTRHVVAVTWIAAFVLAGASLAQLSAIVPSTRTWSRTYGGSVPTQGVLDLRQMPGGRLVVAGFTASFGSGTPFHWLMDLEQGTGKVLTESALSSAAGGFADGAAVAADGGALFLGRNVIDLFTKHDAWLVRVDEDGGVAWSERFTAPGAGRFFLYDAAELADGSWIAVGTAGVFDFPPQHAWVLRLAANGAPLWSFEYGGGSVESPSAVTPTADGGFAVAGASDSSGAGGNDVWVLKLDGSGNVQWERTYGGFDADQAEDIVALDGGGFAVVGSSNSLTPSGHTPWVLRLSATGNVLWHRAVGDDVWGDLGGIAQTTDGQIVVVGRVSQTGFPTNDLWCAKLAPADGKVLWQRAYEGDSGDFGSVVLPLASGGGFVLGGTWGWGFEDESIWLQRTDRSGGLPTCDLVRTTSFAMLEPAITVQHGIAVRTPGTAQLAALGVQLAPSAAKVIEVCGGGPADLAVPGVEDN